MYRRIAVVASLAVVAAMFVGSSTASAQTAGGCVFTGLAGDLIDDEYGPTGIPSAHHDFTHDSELHDFEFGSYDYSGFATCGGVFDGTVVTPSQDNAFITSNGRYENIVCGTGWALDPDGSNTVVTVQGPTAAIEVTDVGYEIPFVGGNGPLHIGTGLPSTAPAHTGTIGGRYTGSGAVHIQPRSPGNCATEGGDVNAFDVAGSFSIVD